MSIPGPKDQFAGRINIRVVPFFQVQAIKIHLAPKGLPGGLRQRRKRLLPSLHALEQRIPELLHRMRLYRMTATKLLQAIGVID
jgi:hypothetical protein